jgi:hypothetical protein
MTGSRIQWCPTAEEVAKIVGELRPVITAICERQMAELELLGAVFPGRN